MRFLCLFLCIFQSGPSWSGLLYFDYAYSDGTALSGVLEGSVQADYDTVVIRSIFQTSYNGVVLSPIEEDDIASVSDFPRGDLQPLVSFSGNIMDLFVCPNGFTRGNCAFSDESGFYFQSSSRRLGVGDGGGQALFEGFSVNRWSLRPAEIPEPLSLLLFVTGLIFFQLSVLIRRLSSLN